MAASAESSSSSATSSTPKRRHPVFLSYWGEDIRHTFTDHLYVALRNEGIVTFRDQGGLEKGEVISEEQQKAIEESSCAVVIISEDYAHSPSCLDELIRILQYKRELGLQVFPVFYGVDPYDMRHQKGTFAEAFKIHEQNFKEDGEKVRQWRAALTQVANISGLSSSNRYQADLIENITEALSAKRPAEELETVSSRLGRVPYVPEYSSSSASKSTPRRRGHQHDVFLSYWGEDPGRNFIDDLYNVLKNKEIIAFRDKEGLEREVISEELLKAIEESLCAVVILSENYAYSTRCLDELRKILQSQRELGLKVFAVFYYVHRFDVRRQRGTFSEAFKIHEQNFKEDGEKVRQWRAALTEVAASTTVWRWTVSDDSSKTDVIEHLAGVLSARLFGKFPFRLDGLVGIASKVKKVVSLLEMGPKDVHYVGIWGMGGTGKTTLASTVYEGIQGEFERHCFLPNVREEFEKLGLVQLQRKILYSLRLTNLEIKTALQGRQGISRSLWGMKVLLVLDDVTDERLLENLVGQKKWLGPGSRVLITTRNNHLLASSDVNFIRYDIELLNSDESLRLFCNHAFPKINHPPEGDYLRLSKSMVEYCGGLPLALKVLGSHLRGRSVFEWYSTFKKVERSPDTDIMKMLRITYDELSELEKAILLDIVCFFNGLTENMLTVIWKDCGYEAKTLGLQNLVDKSLLSIVKSHIHTHDLLVKLGKRIVFEESPHDASKRSRLCYLDEIDEVMTQNKGSDIIQGMVFSSLAPFQADWREDCFSKMSGLRLLIAENLQPLHGLKSFPSALRFLYWMGYPLKALPDIDQSNELVDLILIDSKLSQLWDNPQFLGKLKYINLTNSKDLTRTPDFDGIPNLEKLILEGCESLVEVHESLGKHKRLCKVDFTGCKNLKTLPSELSMNSLKTLTLSGCLKLEKLSEFGENMGSLSELELEKTAIVGLPPSLGFLTGLSVLKLEDCKNLISLPDTVCNLNSLRILNICGCTQISGVPDNFFEKMQMVQLIAAGTTLTYIPGGRGLKPLPPFSFES